MDKITYTNIFEDAKISDNPDPIFNGNPTYERQWHMSFRVSVFEPDQYNFPILIKTILSHLYDDPQSETRWLTLPNVTKTNAIRQAIKMIDDYKFPWEREN